MTRRMRTSFRSILAPAFLVLAAAENSWAQAPDQRTPLQACLAIADGDARLGCIRGLISQGDRSPASLAGSWPLIRSQDPSGARIVSIARSADPSRSDVDLAGLMIRCMRPNAFEVVVALVGPLPIRTRQTVRLESGRASLTFEGESIAPGSLLLLPPEAADAIMIWKENDQLTVTIQTSPNVIRGVIPISGLASGLRKLTEACATP